MVEDPDPKLTAFLTSGCGCTKQCSGTLDKRYYYVHRLHMADLTREQLDFYIMGQIVSHLHCEGVFGRKHKHPQAVRKQSKVTYSHLGEKICIKTFLALHNIG